MKLSGISIFAGASCMAVAAADRQERLEVRRGDDVVFAWQKQPLSNPVGGEKFAASAFIHSMRTPAGFEWTLIQPADHLHHFGLWWPWKFIEIDGRKFNCWEIQEGEGDHVAREVKALPSKGGLMSWEFTNETRIKRPDSAPLAVIRETATVSLLLDKDANTLDISLVQKALGRPVTIMPYRYSGFTWRGPASWNKDNSTLTSSEGGNRETANGTHARWLLANGPGIDGPVFVLIMSAASKLAGKPEKLRVWNADSHDGTPFVNFNPVADDSIPLDDAHPAVSSRKYRIIAADRAIDATAAGAEWEKWMAEP